MELHESTAVPQLAADFCDCVAVQAAKVGFYEGLITAVFHQGEVVRVYIEFADDEPPPEWVAPSCQPGLNEALQALRRATREGLKHCLVRYGSVMISFHGGALFKVTVAENFLITKEIPELGRVFALPLEHPLNGHCTCSTAGNGNGWQPQAF